MSDALDFQYSLDVARLTGPAAEAARALGLLNNKLGSLAKALEKIESGSGAGLAKVAKAVDGVSGATTRWGASTSKTADASGRAARRIADEWEKLAERAEKAEQKKTRAMERELGKQVAAAERAAAKISKANAKAAEKASHKSFFGGETSLGGLFGARAEAKTSGIVTGMADSVLGLPGTIIGGAFSAVGSVVTAGASLAYEFGKMAISSQAMRENSVAAFQSIYGSADIGNDLFDRARQMAQQTKFETQDVVRIYNTLAANNFKADELEKYSWAVADISSARGSEKGEQFLTAISKIRSSKTATFGTLQSAGGAGPGAENVFRELGQITGKGEMGRAQWQKYLRGNTVTREQALQAVMQATASTYDKQTGKIGEFAKQQGMGTWEGLLSNIGEGLGNTLRSKLVTSIPALESFKDVLRSISTLFDEDTDRGKRFASLTAKFVEDVFLPFGGLGLESTGNILDRLLDMATDLEPRFKALMQSAAEGVNKFLEDPKASLISLATDIGVAVGAGIWEGIKAVGAGAAQQAAMGLQESLVQKGTILGGIQDVIDAHGPSSWSRKAAGIPSQATDGRATDIPSHATGGRVTGSYYGEPKLIMAHVGETVSGLDGEWADHMSHGGGRGGGGEIHNEFHFHGLSSQEAADAAVLRAMQMCLRNPNAATIPGS